MRVISCIPAFLILDSVRNSKTSNSGILRVPTANEKAARTTTTEPVAGTTATARSGAQALSRRAHELIPGGCHTYAKGDDQFPRCAPPFIARGRGCRVWDLDGNEF